MSTTLDALKIKNEQGEWISIPGLKGPQGDPGPEGQQGQTGATPELTIGVVQTLPAGQDATAVISGTAEDPVLNLGLPVAEVDDIVVVSDTQPTSENNVVWIDSSEKPLIQIPTLDEVAALLPKASASGNWASLQDGAADMPLISLVATIPYTAAGVTGLKGRRTGKNMAVSYSFPSPSYAPGFNKDTYTRLPAGIYRILLYITGTATWRKKFSCFDTEDTPTRITANKPFIIDDIVQGQSYYSGTSWWQDGGNSVIINSKYEVTREHWVLYGLSPMDSPAEYDYKLAVYPYDTSDANTEYIEPDVTEIAKEFLDENDDPITIYGGTYDFISGKLVSTLAADGTALAEPVEYELGGQTIKTLYGDNNFVVFGSSNVSAAYYADIQKYIQSVISA